jgi:hypothetical protein
VLDLRPQIAEVLKSACWLRAQSTRLLSGLGLAGISPIAADAARKGEHRADKHQRKTDDPQDHGNQSKRGSDQENDGKANSEDRDSSDKSDKSDKSGKRDRNETSSQGDGSEQSGSDSGKSRGESRRGDADSDSSSRETSSADNGSSQRSGRRVEEFEQQADEPANDTLAQTTVTPANPNVVVDDIPSTSIADLVVEANDDVVATVSTSGGFAFARSGDVIAVTGPDGATIVQTGDVTTGASGTRPEEPSDDGGNNDLDFSS